jgi:anion-transporting  ArsA/GET3 family ATPase
MIRKLILPFTIILLTITSCKKDEDPVIVAEMFLNAMQERDYETAKKYGTIETIKLLEQFEKIEELNDIESEEAPGKISILSEDIRGVNAIVYFTEAGNNAEQKISLKKVETPDGKMWKVALKKEEIKMIQNPGS